MRYLLDTSLISQTAKNKPQSDAITWLGTVDLNETYLSAITFAALRRGVERLPEGRMRRDLEVWLGAAAAVEYAKRTLPVDAVVAVVADLAGELLVEAERVGLNLDLTDFLIAATARVHGLQVATLNREHFEKLGVELVEF